MSDFIIFLGGISLEILLVIYHAALSYTFHNCNFIIVIVYMLHGHKCGLYEASLIL